jgi:hypothetical protein
MGYKVRYSLYLEIHHSNFKKALEIMNHLHSDEMLLKYANGGMYGPDVDKLPIREKKWYRWVSNPEKPYSTLKEAFMNWGIVEDNINIYLYEYTGRFVIEGTYDNKIGQQDVLLKHLAPVLENTQIVAIGEDNDIIVWSIIDHEFNETVFRVPKFDDPNEFLEEKDKYPIMDEETKRLAL